MNFEQYLPEIKNKSPEAVDEKWYERFEKIAAFQDYEYLEGNKDQRESQKSKFLSGEINNPKLDYPKLESFPFQEKEGSLLILKKDILDNEHNETVKQLYRWRINEKLAELRMLMAARDGNDKRFSRYSSFIYGNPDKKMHNYTLSQIRNIIDKKLSDPDMNIREAAQNLNAELFESLMNAETDIDPEAFNLPEIKSNKEDITFSAEEIRASFEKALGDYKIDGWEIIVDDSSAINVSQERKVVRIPQTRKLKQTELEAIIKHELGTHVYRRESGSRTKLRLLGLGLDRFLKGEEGVATYSEQMVLGTSDFAGFDGHLAIALAAGVDRKKRTFREVFEILKNFYFIKSTKNKDEAIESAKKAAWDRCVRTFRGTSCQTAGACFTRDIVYREGNIGIWNVIRNKPAEEKRFSIGKYDPANPRHIWILEQLGITDDELNNLEK